MDKIAVAPFVGAWIEIAITGRVSSIAGSLPSWERGLKYGESGNESDFFEVAPFVGAWIEIYEEKWSLKHNTSRSLRGSVD